MPSPAKRKHSKTWCSRFVSSGLHRKKHHALLMPSWRSWCLDRRGIAKWGNRCSESVYVKLANGTILQPGRRATEKDLLTELSDFNWWLNRFQPTDSGAFRDRRYRRSLHFCRYLARRCLSSPYESNPEIPETGRTFPVPLTAHWRVERQPPHTLIVSTLLTFCDTHFGTQIDGVNTCQFFQAHQTMNDPQIV